jgi:membrane-associated protease RseP (regulator of RpoE activity)
LTPALKSVLLSRHDPVFRLAAMNRRLRFLGLIAILAALLFLVWREKTASPVVSASGNAMAGAPAAGSNGQISVGVAVANSLAPIKRQFNGGVGLQLKMDVSTGLPEVAGVVRGSPAETAGLRAGDLLLKVGDQATTGQSLAQVVEEIRGLTLGRVTVTVQRPGSSNLTFEMPRSSWNALGMTNMYSAPAAIPPTL